MTPGSTDTGFAHIELAVHSLLRPETGLSPLRLPRDEEAALLDLYQHSGPVGGDREASWVSHGQPASRMLTGHTNPSRPSVPHPACTGDQAQGDYPDHFPGKGDEGRQNPGYQTSGMSTSLGRHAPPSVYQGRERRYHLISGDAGPYSPGHQTFDMSAGLARSALPPEVPPRQAVESAHAEPTQGRQGVHSAPAGYSYMRTDTSVLELAGFDASDTVPRREPCRSSQDMWLESVAETQPLCRVMNMRLENPPMHELLENGNPDGLPRETHDIPKVGRYPSRPSGMSWCSTPVGSLASTPTTGTRVPLPECFLSYSTGNAFLLPTDSVRVFR